MNVLSGQLRLAEIVACLSLATDLGTGLPLETAFHSCLLAVRLGRRIGLSDEDLGSAYLLALLYYVGCTSTAHAEAAAMGSEIEVRRRVKQIDSTDGLEFLRAALPGVGAGRPLWARIAQLGRMAASLPRLGEGIRAHCEIAQMVGARLALGPAFEAMVQQLFERWDGKGQPYHLKGKEILVPARLVALTDRACSWASFHGIERAIKMVQAREGTTFDPHLASAFGTHGRELLSSLPVAGLWDEVMAAEPAPQRWLEGDSIQEACLAVADFADVKSPFTLGHSRRVAESAARAAKALGLPEVQIRTVRLAGLLHDVGRVGVSSDVWDKPGQLTESERERVRLHPYYTERILSRLGGLADVAAIASRHHERLDSSGYHRGLSERELPLLARLLAAADVFAALTEARPHRSEHSPERVAAILDEEVKAGRLDGPAVAAVLRGAGLPTPTYRSAGPAGLSKRELEVLALIARGLTNREVAARLFVSPVTVGHHVEHIYEKIGTSTRAAATLFALQNGLL